MIFRSQTSRRCIVALAAMLTCAAMAQTPAPAATPNVAPADSRSASPTDPVAAYQAVRAGLRRDELLHAAQNLAAKPAVPGPVEREGTPAAAEAPQPGKFGQEGIRIHGHWVIDVKNPDGTLAGHHDFQNSLQSGGAFVLAGALNSEFVPANWMIGLSGTTQICASSGLNLCGIVQSQSTYPAATYCVGGNGTCVTGLTTGFIYSTPPVSFILSGNFTATQTGNINQVGTYMGFCFTAAAATYSPQTCAVGAPFGGSSTLFSSTGITAIPVNSGQIVQVTVTFTFS